MNKVLLIVIAASLAAIGCSGPEQKDTAAAPEIKRTMDTTFVTAESTRVERFRIYSPSMKRDIKAVVVLPPEYDANPDKKYPVLYTLHGHGAPYDTWANMPKLRKQLKDKPFIYTCFDGDVGSNYIDALYPIRTERKIAEGQDTLKQTSLFMTFFFKEFVPGIDSWYRINTEKRGVTGFSMGGGGAMGYGLAHPEMFCSVSGLSSSFKVFDDVSGKPLKWCKPHLGSYEENRAAYDALDHKLLIEKHLAAGVKLPPIYQHIGTEDTLLLPLNRRMKEFAEEKGLDYTYEESPGAHNWKFWHPASVGVAEFHWKYFK